MADDDYKHGIVSRKDAIKRGLKFYRTGKPCLRGHIGLRDVRGASCCECAKIVAAAWRRNNLERARSRDRSWYANNPDKVKKKYARNYAKNGVSIKEHHKKRYAENPETYREKTRAWRKNNPEKAAESNRLNSKRYRREHPEEAKQHIDNWWAKNPGKKKTYHRNRKARKRNNGGTHTADDIADIFRLQRGKCAYCKTKLIDGKWHVDHVVALKNGGTNDRKNLQILCEPCNLEKGTRDPIVHMQSLGRLL